MRASAPIEADPIAFLTHLFEVAVARAQPRHILPRDLPLAANGRTVALGIGKASAGFARALEDRDASFDESLFIAPKGTKYPTARQDFLEASHPVPDETSLEGARRALNLVGDLTEEDHLLVFLSGGGSALMTCPAGDLTLADKIRVTQEALACGASIDEINCLRKHLSAIKGGGLARAAFPARVSTFAISDVVGNDPATIASGPTVGDPTTQAEARAILERYHLKVSPAVKAHLMNPDFETPFPDDPIFAHSTYELLVTPAAALERAANEAQREAADLTVHNLGDAVTGDVVEVAGDHAALIQNLRAQGGNHLILSGGELTVTLPSVQQGAKPPRGGPNQTYLLALAEALGETPGTYALAADTDGLDGASGAAGAFITPQTFEKAANLGVNLADALAKHSSSAFFSRLEQEIVTGPTHTNVNDFRAIVMLERPQGAK